jgi:predicted secreted hydrolase
MMARVRTLAIALAAICLALALLFTTRHLLLSKDTPESRTRIVLSETLAAEGEGFRRAVEPRAFDFPADHGPHPEYRIEWWYFTGNLMADEGRRFGYQLTFFRRALAAGPVSRSSAWGARQVYMAHFALTDVGGGRFHAFGRFSRAALELAGARSRPFRAWVEKWEAGSAGEAFLPLRLRAEEEGVSIDLTLTSSKDVVFHGDRGLSVKGPGPGNASYYYSMTRMPTGGTVRSGGKTYSVRGESWMDREWSTSSLDEGQEGWDWFALQLSDGRELMCYLLRRKDGSLDAASSGTLVEKDGASRALRLTDITVEVLDHWESPKKVRYPSGWRLSVPGEEIALTVEPYLKNQEMDLSVRYWEGAVSVEGSSRGRAVTGSGYVELAGY